MEIIDNTHTYIYVQAHGEREGEREEREGVYMCASVCVGMNVCLWVGEFRDLLRQPAASAGELEKGCSRPSGEKIDSRTYFVQWVTNETGCKSRNPGAYAVHSSLPCSIGSAQRSNQVDLFPFP